MDTLILVVAVGVGALCSYLYMKDPKGMYIIHYSTKDLLKAGFNIDSYLTKEAEYHQMVTDIEGLMRGPKPLNAADIRHHLNKLRDSPFFSPVYRAEFENVWTATETDDLEIRCCNMVSFKTSWWPYGARELVRGKTACKQTRHIPETIPIERLLIAFNQKINFKL